MTNLNSNEIRIVEVTNSGSLDQLVPPFILPRSEIPKIPLDAENPHYHSRFTSLGTLIEKSIPALMENGLMVMQFPVSSNRYDPEVVEITKGTETTFTVVSEVGLRTFVLHISGQYMASTVRVPVYGYNIAQEAGKAITYLRRYAWASVLGLYSDEDTDAEGGSNGKGKAETTNGGKGKYAEENRPYEAEVLKSALDIKTKNLTEKYGGDVRATDKQRNLVGALLSEVFQNDTYRHIAQQWLLGVSSVKNMEPAQIRALLDWLKPEPDSGGKLVIDALARKELVKILPHVLSGTDEDKFNQEIKL